MPTARNGARVCLVIFVLFSLLTAAAAEDDRRTIVTVVDVNGRPLQGATVRITRTVPHRHWWSKRSAPDTTGKDGTVQLAGPTAFSMRLRAQHAGSRAAGEVEGVRSGDPVTITVRPGSQVVVQVVSPAGGPVPHAIVSIRPTPRRRGVRAVSTRADSKGTAVFEGVMPGRYDGSIDAWGYERTSVSEFAVDADSASRQSTVVGHGRTHPLEVVLANGKPAQSVRIRVVGLTDADGHRLIRGRDGKFSLPSFPNYATVELVDAAGGVALLKVMPNGIQPCSTIDGVATVTLKKPVTLRGRAQGARGTKTLVELATLSFPVPNLGVRTHSVVRLSADGRYEFRGVVPHARFVVRVNPSGRMRNAAQFGVTGEPGSETEAMLRRTSAGSLKISVVGPKKEPLPDAIVTIVPNTLLKFGTANLPFYALMEPVPYRTDARGTVVITSEANTTVRIGVRCRGFLAVRAFERRLPGSGTETLKVQLGVVRRIEGAVRTPEGIALANVMVRVYPVDPRARELTWGRTDSRGRYVVEVDEKHRELRLEARRGRARATAEWRVKDKNTSLELVVDCDR